MTSFMSSDELTKLNQDLLQVLSETQGSLQVAHMPASTLAMSSDPIPLPGALLQVLLGVLKTTMLHTATILLLENSLDEILSALPDEQQKIIKDNITVKTAENIQSIKAAAKQSAEEAAKQKIAVPLGSSVPPNLRGPK